jgi:hypothetical protein
MAWKLDRSHFLYFSRFFGNSIEVISYISYIFRDFIAVIAVEGEQYAVDHCGNDGNFLPYSIIFILFTVHYYFDTRIQMLIKSCVNYYFSLFSSKKKTLKKYVNMFLACQQTE